tara:strand:- start:1597 stop:2271 length:675 start_codon:yes stop_codon:yes gene_type:complete
MTFLRQLLANRPVREQLPFGINERVKIVSINNDPRKRNGEVVNQNTYINFVKFDEDDAKISSKEFSWFNAQHDSEYLLENIATQLTQLTHIMNAYGIDEELDPTVGYESEEEMIEELSSKAGLKAFLGLMWEMFSEELSDKIGPDSKFINLKVVTDYKGKYIELPKVGNFIEEYTEEADKEEGYKSTLTLTPKEVQAKLKATQPNTAKPDAEGNKPPEAALSGI